MPLTITMIEEKEFKRKRNGYDIDEVDRFLDEICDEMERQQNEVALLYSKLAAAGSAAREVKETPRVPDPLISAVPSPAPVYMPQEAPQQPSETAQKVLERAQKMYDDIVKEAEEKAESILNDARSNAGGAYELSDLKAQKAQLEQEIEQLKAAAQDYRRRFRQLVEDQNHLLNSEKVLFE